ncbi:hypothetical protein MVES_000710 [Malassezia vespertilionis]|uniref:Importin N-terminal domain-containing protein n=1 Tax=Malassezia vespertilionis TaxID=2020962 RepID=A0A2N1JGG0_9BASI|nr:hypothetical protein MVES_000710 [Malassezia vespertilionis]
MSAVPFGPHALLDTLYTAAAASDAATLRDSNAQLDSWEALSTYWEALLHVAFDRGVTSGKYPAAQYEHMRRLAIIRFKNGVAKFWRPRIVNRVAVKIDPATKERLRASLMGVLHEPDRVVAVQAAVAIAKLARLDYPDEWPRLIPMLREAILSSIATMCAGDSSVNTARQTLVLLRAADVLRQCVKEFGTVRVLAGKLRMSELARLLLPELQPSFGELFYNTFPFGPHSTPDAVLRWANEPGIVERIRAAHLLFKVLHRLSLADSGVISSRIDTSQGKPNNLAYNFFVTTPSQLQVLAGLRDYVVGSEDAALGATIVPLTKYMIAYGKFHLALIAKLHNNVSFWPAWPEIAWWYWSILQRTAADGSALSVLKPEAATDADMRAAHPYKWLVIALVLLRTTLFAWKRNRPAGSAFVGMQGAQFELDATQVLLNSYLRLSQQDLQRWEESAETFAIEETQADPNMDIRPAAERLLLVLSQNCTRGARNGVDQAVLPHVSEFVYSKFEEAATMDTLSLDAVLARDALYTGLGLCRDQLDPALSEDEVGSTPHDPADMDRLTLAIRARFVPEAMYISPRVDAAWIVMRRRIAWLLWEWSEYVRSDMRQEVYATLVSLMVTEYGRTDAAVQLAATRSLSALADTVEFEPDVFEPFLGDALAHMLRLVAHGDLEEPDSIRTVAKALSVIIERVGPRIVPFTPKLVEMLPVLWEHDDPEARVKPSILEFLGKLATASSAAFANDPRLQHLHEMIVRIVHASLSPALAPLLGFDGLLLFARTVQATPNMTAPLFGALALVSPLVLQPDYAPLACHVWEGACLLAPVDALQHYGSEMYATCASVLGEKDSPVVLSPLTALHCHLRALSVADAPDAIRYFAEILHTTHLFPLLLSTLLRGEETSVIESQFVVVLCRMAFLFPLPFFLELVRGSVPTLLQVWEDKPTLQATLVGKPAGSVWDVLIPYLVRCVQSMSSVSKMKLCSLGAATILRGAGPEDIQVLANLPALVGMWTDVLGLVVENEEGDSSVYNTDPLHDRVPGNEMLDDELELGFDSYGPLEDTTPSGKRADALLSEEAARKTPLRPYLFASLNSALAAHPPGTPSGVIRSCWTC